MYSQRDVVTANAAGHMVSTRYACGTWLQAGGLRVVRSNLESLPAAPPPCA